MSFIVCILKQPDAHNEWCEVDENGFRSDCYCYENSLWDLDDSDLIQNEHIDNWELDLLDDV